MTVIINFSRDVLSGRTFWKCLIRINQKKKKKGAAKASRVTCGLGQELLHCGGSLGRSCGPETICLETSTELMNPELQTPSAHLAEP